MGEKLSAFNPVEFMQDDDEIAEYLTEAYLDEDPNVFIVALGHVTKHKGLSTAFCTLSMSGWR